MPVPGKSYLLTPVTLPDRDTHPAGSYGGPLLDGHTQPLFDNRNVQQIFQKFPVLQQFFRDRLLLFLRQAFEGQLTRIIREKFLKKERVSAKIL
jgi:hypothetical protein